MVMNRNGFSIGDKVMFGRRNGEQTLGEIVKLNPKRAKVRQLEARGVRKAHNVGAVWGVPYSLLVKVDEEHVMTGMTEPLQPKNPTDTTIPTSSAGASNLTAAGSIEYDPSDTVNNLILEAINQVYTELSPEWLTNDGELPSGIVKSKEERLQRQLQGLQMAYGSLVSEIVALNWYREKVEYQARKTA